MIWTYVWLGVIALALIVEVATADLLTIWFAGGGIVALILSACGLDWYVQLPAFIVISLGLLFCIRRIAMKYLKKEAQKTNADSAIGKEFILHSEIAFEKLGTIKINGVLWSAKTVNDHETIAEGEIVKVISLEGNKYIVEKQTKKNKEKNI